MGNEGLELELVPSHQVDDVLQVSAQIESELVGRKVRTWCKTGAQKGQLFAVDSGGVQRIEVRGRLKPSWETQDTDPTTLPSNIC